MKKKLLLSLLLVALQTICFSQKTFTGATPGNWNTAANWTPVGVPTVSDDVIIPVNKTVNISSNAVAKSVSISGVFKLNDAVTLTIGTSTVSGNFTVNSGGVFNMPSGSGVAILIVYGNYLNYGITDFWKSTVIIVGDLLSPSTSALQNNGNVVVGGNIIGDFNLTGGTGSNQIYAVNPNATVTITPTSIDNNVPPGGTVESSLTSLVNEVIYGITSGCTVNITAPTTKSICETSSTTFSIVFPNPQPASPSFQWQLKIGDVWTDLSNDLVYSGVTNAILSITGATSSMNGNKYRAKIMVATCSRNSDYATLNVGNSTVTWSGTAWSSAPTANDKVIFNGNYNSTGNLSACSCIVNSGNVVFNSGHSFILINDVKINGGSLTFEDTASLVQTNNNLVNLGAINYKRKTTPLKQFDYTYWSSPLENQTLSQLATNSLFYGYNTAINNYEIKPASTIMQAGVGYLGRAPSNLNYATSQIVETTFVGVPNNGVYSTPIIKSTSVANLIGNPYPSAIYADLFITNPSNINIINGTLYFWTHNTAITSNNYTANDYAKYNLIGGVKTASAALSGGVVPNGKIASGQGFFVEANSTLANGTYAVTFNNSMRISNNNNQFFKTSQLKTNESSTTVSVEKHRFWISLFNDEGSYNEFLVGYATGASNDFDPLYDGRTLPAGNSISIYTLLDSSNLSIQGRSLPFSESDIIPVGYSSTYNGQLSINLESFDGLFESQNIYLYDKSSGTYHNIKSNYYTFTTASGTFNDRFEIRFTNTALSNDSFTGLENDIIVYNQNDQFIVSSKNESISKVELYDLLGKQIISKDKLDTNEFRTNLFDYSNKLFIAKVTLSNEQTFIKKIILK